MFPIKSPKDLHEEYQARVDTAVRQASLVSAARQAARQAARPGAWARVRARFVMWRAARAARPQPVESKT